jgi:hypothetical protein
MIELTPKQAAKMLFSEGWTAEEYANGVQAHRLKRMETWKLHHIKALLEKETELILYGERVIEELKLLTTNHENKS